MQTVHIVFCFVNFSVFFPQQLGLLRNQQSNHHTINQVPFN